MRCSSRSTISSSSALAALALAVTMAAPASGAPATPAGATGQRAAVRTAIIAAVRARVGEMAEVQVDDLLVQTSTVDGLTAVPEPGARFGRLVRFTLKVAGTGAWQLLRPVGDASAVVHVTVPHVVAARPLPRGTTLTPRDLTMSTADLTDLPIAPLPAAEDLVGARTVIDLVAGAPLTTMVTVIPPLVRSGDQVLVRVVFPGGEVTGKATAAQSGARGDVIRLVNPASGRALQGRVVGEDEVEVVQ
ncbi:MAG: flagellar basal body P-ring formation protein FlgA [Acidobacteriota bacterium]|nr:flagellar basal body P-ring formation protein FlgA [Acidobacteriota bacterium]